MARKRWQVSGAEMLDSMLARGEVARQRYLTQLKDGNLTQRRRRLAACHLRVLQRQLEMIGHLSGQ
jgi:hypothetical protein